MSLSLRLDLRQSQTLVMTPQLQQAIKLLQLPNLELAAYVAQELEQNPLLEPAEAADDGAAVSEDEPDPDNRAAELTGRLVDGRGRSSRRQRRSRPTSGWADPQRDDLPGGLAVDGFAADRARRQPRIRRRHVLISRRGSVSPGACATTSSNSCISTCRPVLSA